MTSLGYAAGLHSKKEALLRRDSVVLCAEHPAFKRVVRGIEYFCKYSMVRGSNPVFLDCFTPDSSFSTWTDVR